MTALFTIVCAIAAIVALVFYITVIVKQSFAFNAEFVVAVCFVIFVALTIRGINKTLSLSMKERSDQIKEEYQNLRNLQKSNLKLIVGIYQKYSEFVEYFTQLFAYAVTKSFEMHQHRRMVSLNKANSSINKAMTAASVLENAYRLKYKYYFITRFFFKLSEGYVANHSDIQDYLSSVHCINNVAKNQTNSENTNNVSIVLSML